MELPPALQQLRLHDYTYHLPEDRIADRPASPRDASRLLAYRQGKITHHRFSDLPSLVSNTDVLVFNNTRVIPARFFGRRASGGAVEMLLVHPHTPPEMAAALQAQRETVWECMVGNLKRWKVNEILDIDLADRPGLGLKAQLVDKSRQWVRFFWEESGMPFARIMTLAGEIPLPPYIRRAADTADKNQYQTVYAREEGAVAAPTAGLHFTPQLLTRLRGKAVRAEYVTLHVSAGTFLPVKTDEPARHPMHAEQMVLHRDDLSRLQKAAGRLVAVGTTSLRCLESLVWLGYALRTQPAHFRPDAHFMVPQLIPYTADPTAVKDPAGLLGEVISFMDTHRLDTWVGETRLMILPGYPFSLARGLITNFHQPGSTLILLVAAWLGADWRSVYDAALANGYRFLSYGDSSLLWRA